LLPEPDALEELPMKLQVTSVEGLHGDPEPRAFMLGEQRIEVLQIIDRWLSSDYGYYKFDGSDGHRYILRHDRPCDSWELTLFQTSTDLSK
jgi:hypothetical protein